MATENHTASWLADFMYNIKMQSKSSGSSIPQNRGEVFCSTPNPTRKDALFYTGITHTKSH